MTITIDQQVHILQVVGEMSHGGTENWLMHMLRKIDRTRYRMDFLVSTDTPVSYDEEIQTLGGRIIPCLHPDRPVSYGTQFLRILAQQGPFHVVHCHLYWYCGYILYLAHLAHIPGRIAHSHTDLTQIDTRASIPRHAYTSLMHHWILRHATQGFATSANAATALFGQRWQRYPQIQTLPCGIDLPPFMTTVDRIAVRRELDIPLDVPVIGHVGRFDRGKNHAFILDIMRALRRGRPDIYLLLIGDGPLRPEIEQQAARLGFRKQVIFTGVRNDVPRLMLGAMDLFLFPSLFEGLGLALLEAQAARLHCVCSDSIPGESVIVSSLVRRMSLAQPASAWADVILHLFTQPVTIPSEQVWGMIAGSPINSDASVRVLETVYERYAQASTGNQPATRAC